MKDNVTLLFRCLAQYCGEMYYFSRCCVFSSNPRKTSCDILFFSCILCFTSRFLAAAVNVNFAHHVKSTKVSTQNRLNIIMHPEFDQNGSF